MSNKTEATNAASFDTASLVDSLPRKELTTRVELMARQVQNYYNIKLIEDG